MDVRYFCCPACPCGPGVFRSTEGFIVRVRSVPPGARTVDWATVVGSVAAVCTTGAFVPQVVRVWRLKSAGHLSLPTFVLFSFGVAVWLAYGVLIDSLPVILANAATLGLSLALVFFKVRYDRGERSGQHELGGA